MLLLNALILHTSRFPDGMLSTFRDEMQLYLQDVVDAYPDTGQLYRPYTPAVPVVHLARFGRGIVRLLEVCERRLVFSDSL